MKSKKNNRIYFTVTLSEYEGQKLRPFFISSDKGSYAKLIKRLVFEAIEYLDNKVDLEEKNKYISIENRVNAFLEKLATKLEEIKTINTVQVDKIIEAVINEQNYISLRINKLIETTQKTLDNITELLKFLQKQKEV